MINDGSRRLSMREFQAAGQQQRTSVGRIVVKTATVLQKVPLGRQVHSSEPSNEGLARTAWD